MKQPNDVPKPNPRNAISLEGAKKWAKRWRKKESKYNKHNDCRAFNIPKKDLIEVLNEDGVESVRAYLGVEKLRDKDTGKKYYVEKLMFVGVDANGKDMISSSDGITLDNGPLDIYDFSTPCPTTCDNQSPLNGRV